MMVGIQMETQIGTDEMVEVLHDFASRGDRLNSEGYSPLGRVLVEVATDFDVSKSGARTMGELRTEVFTLARKLLRRIQPIDIVDADTGKVIGAMW